MKILKSKKFKNAGMGLVEIIVALGISVVTLTGAAVFSASLRKRAQENFMEISVLQLQSLVTEELRLVELGLKKDVKEGKRFADNTDFLYKSRLNNQALNWAGFCNQQPGINAAQYLSITLPDFVTANADHKISFGVLSQGAGVDVRNNVEGMNNVLFYPIPSSVQFGAFSSTNARVAIQKYIDSSDSGGLGLGNTIKFKIIVNYTLFGNDERYTVSQDVTMIHNLVCKQP
jgi:hypothetical protein